MEKQKTYIVEKAGLHEVSPYVPQRKNLRLKGFDYSTPGNYFITIVTQNRLEVFGNVVNEEMVYNEAGEVVNKYLRGISAFHQGCEVPFLMVMPNHVHFILSLSGGVYLAEIIRRMKSFTTHEYIEGVKHKNWPPFDGKLWQRNYYEHIIRNQRSYEYIANYIITNPQRWIYDKLNSGCIAESDNINQNLKMMERD